jgi:hypothetical protein
LTGNLFSGEDNFRGLLIVWGVLRSGCVFGDGVVRLFNIFNGEVGSRSIGLLAASRETLPGEGFSEFSVEPAIFATKGELGGPSVSVSVSVSVYVWEVQRTSYSWLEILLGVAELSAASPALDNGDPIPIDDDTWFQTPRIMVRGVVVDLVNLCCR